MFYTYVVNVLSGCCECVTTVFKCFSRVFASVSDTCFKCRICLLLYVANIASGYFKSISGVAQRCAWEARGGASGPRVSVARAPMWARETQAREGDV